MRGFVLLAVFIAISQEAFAQAECVTTTTRICRMQEFTGYRRVFERLVPATEGTTRELKLSESPAIQLPLHVYKDGLELTAGADYAVQGSKILTLGKSALTPGVYQAAYFVATNQSRAFATASAADAARRILEEYLRRSLDAELGMKGVLARNPALEGQPGQLQQLQTPVAPALGLSDNTQPRGEPESFRLLDSLLQSRATTSRSVHSKRDKRFQHADVAAGLEGLGDVDLPTPFQGEQDGLDQRSLEPSPGPGPKQDREAASERMLRSLRTRRQ